MAVKYYHVTNPHVNYNALVANFATQHNTQWPLANLSITEFDDGTKLIKVDIGGETGLASSAIVTEYDSSEHKSLVMPLYKNNVTENEDV